MPKTKEQFEQIRLERQKIILNAALYLFATRGYDATSSDAISATANCSHGLIYHYYPTKADLVKAVFEDVVHPIAHQIFKDVDFNQKAKFVLTDLTDAFLLALKNSNDEYVWSLHLLLNLHVNSMISPIIKDIDKNKKVHSKLIEIVEQGKAEGDFREASTKEQVATLLALYKGLVHVRLTVGYKKFICPHSDIIMSMLLK